MLEWVKVLAAFVLPRLRWQRRLERDLAIYTALPKGPERREYKRRVTRLTAQIIEYDRDFPMVYKVIGWVAVLCTAGMASGWVFDGPEKTIEGMNYAFGPGWLLMAVPSALIGVWFTINTLRGRVAVGGTPGEHKAYLEAEWRKNDEAHRAAMIRRRAKRAFKP